MTFELATGKPWLREECGWIIYNALQPGALPEDKAILAKTAIDRLCANKFALSPEGVAIWLSVRSRYPEVKLPKQPWRHQDPLHADNQSDFAKVMKESPVRSGNPNGEDEDHRRGMWNSKPHFAWDVVFEIFYQAQAPDAPAPGGDRPTFNQFWKSAVDGKCFQTM